ncbi:acyltransferase [Novosphingobium sp. TH158]|uniref:acyltransferase family protein n=1 Tax=Novosphingobium sp. TH158 TaxID=2067455 RepID=UPI000C7AC2B0|nr:acyltransferase [Novosphingobium sp. TH158]PLK24448.1 acyltransferase [Novosphingobium sp. TH158]
MAGQGARLERLDGMRGLAACVVAFGYHSAQLFDPVAIAQANPGPLAGWFMDMGWAFVDLFFLLSGFIFAHVYLGQKPIATRADLGAFALARVARLYPLHLLTLVLVALFAANPANTGAALLAHLGMAQAFVEPFAETYNGPAWSLTIEFICYIAFAGLAFAGTRALKVGTWLLAGWGAVMLAVHGQVGGPWVADVLPRGLLGFFLGQLLWTHRERLSRLPTWALATAVIAGLVMPTGELSPLLPLLLLAWPAALLLALRLPLAGSKAMCWLGDRSYGIYLIHMPLIYALKSATMQVTDGLEMVAVLAGFAALTCLLAHLSLRWVELPAGRLVRSLPGRLRAAVAQPAPGRA